MAISYVCVAVAEWLESRCGGRKVGGSILALAVLFSKKEVDRRHAFLAPTFARQYRTPNKSLTSIHLIKE